MKKRIKAWAFVATEKGVAYLIPDGDGLAEIFLRKPKPIRNPFDYSPNPKNSWKPTALEITINYEKSNKRNAG